MYTPVKSLYLVILFSILLCVNATAQLTSSPYSIFGMGSIEENGLGESRGMGGTGIAFMLGHSVNFLNPASYNGLDSLATVFELGLFGKYTSYNTTDNTQGRFDATVNSIAMGLKPGRRLATSFGITSYSSVGYNINSQSPVEGTVQTYNKTFSGEGGVNQLILGNSYKIANNLFFGINVIYLFGTITHYESSAAFNYSLKDLTYVSNINLNYGLNYRIVNKEWKYNIGLIYNNGKTLTTSDVSTITANNTIETIKSTTHLYKIPKDYGIGLAAEKDFFKVGIDYELKRWKDINFSNPLLNTRNSNRISLGVEIPSLGLYRGTTKMIFYRFGAEYCESYMIIDNVPINYRSVSFGAGLPVRGALSVINLAFEIGQNGSKQNSLWQENFYTLHIDVSLKDHWFLRKKYN